MADRAVEGDWSSGGESAPAGVGRPRVQLMATCLCDAFYDDVAIATVEVLEHLGCVVEVPEGQTCCGQPAFNAGDWPSARTVARHSLQVFRGDDAIVVPSGSCARMVSHGALLLFEGEADRPAFDVQAGRSWELLDFIVRRLGISRWPGRYARRVVFHRSCHSRGTAYAEAALTLLRSIEGVEVVDFDEVEQCCGFGGTFAVAFPHISRGMGDLKLDHLLATAPEVVVSADMGCLMHLGGLAEAEGRGIAMRHVAQVLRDALGATEDTGRRTHRDGLGSLVATKGPAA